MNRRKNLGAGMLLLSGLVFAGEPLDQLRGDSVSWARLLTPNHDWNIHEDRDPTLAQFIRANTSLDIRMSPQAANPARLEQLCRYPFIYAKDLRWVSNATHRVNLGEYLRRGGFLCVDACATEAVNPDMEVYLRENRAIFERIFPQAQIQKLPETHAVYTSYFKLRRADIYTADMGNQSRCANYGLYGVFVDGRLVAVISMYGLQCGWLQTPQRAPGCMKCMVNIYVHALLEGGATPPAVAPKLKP